MTGIFLGRSSRLLRWPITMFRMGRGRYSLWARTPCLRIQWGSLTSHLHKEHCDPKFTHRLGPACHASQRQGKLYFPSCASLVAVPESDLDSHVFSSKTRTLATGTLAHDNARRADRPCGSRRCFPSKIAKSRPPMPVLAVVFLRKEPDSMESSSFSITQSM
nr:PREDICTED: uncharacterized protein LOC108953096 [Musa acuminata subsp. malaccensis]